MRKPIDFMPSEIRIVAAAHPELSRGYVSVDGSGRPASPADLFVLTAVLGCERFGDSPAEWRTLAAAGLGVLWEG